MPTGELLTKLSIWLAVLAYVIGTGLILETRVRPSLKHASRWVWTVGCAFFLVHVLCAFTYFHHWSHEAAYRETARQTAALTGLHWGGGLYFNYVFAFAWLADVLWWWLAPASFATRPCWLNGAWHTFLFFMAFNGAFIFVHGPIRWFGLLLCLAVAISWLRYWRSAKTGDRPQPNHQS